MESQSNAQGVVSLSGARLPADRGLSSLGLLMQLAGSLSMTSMVLITLMPIFAGGAAGHGTLFLFLMGASGVVRGAFHRAAGNALIYGSVDPKKSVLTYIGVSVVETLVWALIMIKGMNATFTATLPVFSLFLAWPLVLAIVVHHPRYQAVFSQNPLPQGEDQGFEGTGVYMLILGVIGALFSGLMVLLFAKAIFKGASEPAVLMITGVFVMLTIRSVMHTNAGIKSLKGVGAETASDAAAKYYSFGIVSSIIAAAAVLVLMMMTGLHPVGLLMVGLVLGLLLIWPLTLRRFYTERNFGMFLAGNEAPVHRRAPDGGLTALGWLLLGGAAIALGSAPRPFWPGQRRQLPGTDLWWRLARLRRASGCCGIALVGHRNRAGPTVGGYRTDYDERSLPDRGHRLWRSRRGDLLLPGVASTQSSNE